MSSYSDNIPVIQPAMRWAQSPHNTFIEVKFAHRFDSPACLDIFDANITLSNNRTLTVSAMCRNDQKLLRYELDMDLYHDVHPFEVEASIMEEFV